MGFVSRDYLRATFSDILHPSRNDRELGIKKILGRLSPFQDCLHQFGL